MLTNFKNYNQFEEFVTTGSYELNTAEINLDNWSLYYYGLLNILKDGIETDFVQKSFITVRFYNGPVVELSVIDTYFNILMWYLIIRSGQKIHSKHIFFDEAITRKNIKRYIDKFFIKENRKKFSNRELNNIIDDTLHQFSNIDNFSMYLANTINLEDFIDLMRKNPEVYDILHADLSGVPIEDTKAVGMELTNKLIHHIKNSRQYLGYDHCLADSFRACEGINPKQFKEFAVNIGSKPDGQGGVYPAIINRSFMMGGVRDLLSYFIESSTGRIAQIMSKNNVGTSGHFARLLGLNNTDTFLHHDPSYVCDSKNFQIVTIENESVLSGLIDRYYRLHPDGEEYIVNENDNFLLEQTIYLRSPMTCASRSKGQGVCYRCYGDLAYTNCDINIGKIAAEEISSKLTQILLSAKHLLETVIAKQNWGEVFFNYFEIEGNVIKLISDKSFKGHMLVIDQDAICMENEDDFKRTDFDEFGDAIENQCEDLYNEYVTSFSIVLPNKEVVKIDSDDTKMFISINMNELIRKKAKVVDTTKLGLNMVDLEDEPLFFIPIKNDELSKTMDKLMKIINRSNETINKSRHELHRDFVKTVIDGDLGIMSVHCEIILMNQLRAIDDILEFPQWQYPNEQYQILTLNQALTDNPSVTVSLLYQRLSKVLYTPLTFRKTKPSFLDLFFMEQPQQYLNSTDIRPAVIPSDIEENLVKPMIKLDKDEED